MSITFTWKKSWFFLHQCHAMWTPSGSAFIVASPSSQGCRSVEEFHCLNRIEEGTYGVVYRARDKKTNEIVALKRLKMEKEKEGFPITSLREINTLLKAQHVNIVTVRVSGKLYCVRSCRNAILVRHQLSFKDHHSETLHFTCCLRCGSAIAGILRHPLEPLQDY